MRKFYPTPEERAEIVIKKMEQFIRTGRERIAKQADNKVNVMQGISYKKWQDAAKTEIALAIRNAVLDEVKDNKFSQNILMTVGACFVTLGFLGAGIAWGSIGKVLAAALSVIVGIILLAIGVTWLLSGSIGEIISDKRKARIARINNLEKQIKKMESFLLNKKTTLKEEIDKN